ncbi:permease [Zobellia galactanivorans]|uniref:Permease n=1 Tax=Zobellia galactanivorans (strain DSM 12802 / CCUG 47099 / CIP 106680 / NCIMB 13871 / Dsij) TaxID=63186 RepID=G0L4H2_ZOBGA|nr:permease [Zobellia galactanivorans]MDO6809087.1 permease [Zobellia galactanivorans]CAZ95706.1 Permease [Zobellia galactanivorans]
MNEKLKLALDEFIHVGVVLVLIIALVSIVTGLIRAFIPQQKLQKRLSKTGKYSGLMGALLGIPTPFCSASMVPVSMGMIEMGAPFAMVFSFLLSAPLANFVVVGFIFGVFGWKVALVYFLIVFLGSIFFGSIAGKTSLKNCVKRIDLNSKAATNTCTAQPATDCATVSSGPTASCGAVQSPCSDTPPPSTGACGASPESNPKLKEAFTFGWALFKRIFPYVLLGAVISAVSAVFVPDAWVEKYLGNNSPLAIPIAAGIGVPLYLRIEMAIPILKALIVKGMSMGAAMALIIGGTGASLPEIAIISSMLKPKAIIAFVGSVMTMAIVGGFIFYFFF